MPGKKQFRQRNEVENHSQAGRMQCDAAEKVAGPRQRHERIDQSNKVASQRETQPEQRHRPYKFRNPLILPQIPKSETESSRAAIHFPYQKEQGKQSGSLKTVIR